METMMGLICPFCRKVFSDNLLIPENGILDPIFCDCGATCAFTVVPPVRTWTRSPEPPPPAPEPAVSPDSGLPGRAADSLPDNEVERLRSDARRWKDAAEANRDAAMGYQDRALKAEQRETRLEDRAETARDCIRMALADFGKIQQTAADRIVTDHLRAALAVLEGGAPTK